MRNIIICISLVSAVLVWQAGLFTVPTPEVAVDKKEHQSLSPLNSEKAASSEEESLNAAAETEKALPDFTGVMKFKSTEAYESASRYGRLPAHMRDVRLEALSYDETGALIINENIKRVIEFFLMATSIEGYEQAVARLNEYVYLTLPELAAAQADEIVSQYLAYRANLKDYDFSISSDLSDPDVLSSVKLALEEKKMLRRDYLGESVSEALFGYEEAYDSFSVARIEINTNTDLSEAEKKLALAAEEAELPEELAAKMRQKREEEKLKRVISELKAEGGKEQEIYEMRKEFYGESAAERMAYLESNPPGWQDRVRSFYQNQNLILNGSGSQAEKQGQISALKQQMFTKKEQIKLAVQSIRSAY